MQVSYENERDGDRPGLRVVGSSKQLQDDVEGQWSDGIGEGAFDDFSLYKNDPDFPKNLEKRPLSSLRLYILHCVLHSDAVTFNSNVNT